MHYAEPIMRREVEVDTELARLHGELDKASAQLARAVDHLHYTAGDRPTYRSRTFKTWTKTLDEVIAWVAPDVRRKNDHTRAVEAYQDARIDVARIDALVSDQNRLYTGWSRFFLVAQTNGHIHASMHCSTCYPTTQYGWLPQLSGLTEEDAVKAHGPRLCTVCFPSAPVEWTVGVVSTKTYCAADKGSTRIGPNYERCNACGKALRTTNGAIRKHEKKEASK